MNTARLLIASLVLGCCPLFADDVAEMLAFEGTCRNATVGADGHVKLIVAVNGNNLQGVMFVSGWLVGGGDVKGKRDGLNYRFTSIDPVWGLEIEWQGKLSNGTLSGEYVVQPKRDTPRQVGEWTTTIRGRRKGGADSDSGLDKAILKLAVEIMLNSPVKDSKGQVITGAENIFRAVHPAGAGVSVCVEDVEIDWKEDKAIRTFEDIHKFRATYVLYWQGVLTPTGWTRLRLAYNANINAITSHEIIESTGTTSQDAVDIAFGIGALLGKAAVDSLFNSK